MTFAIGCDHSAVQLKTQVRTYLESKGIHVIDHGAFDTTSTDYPIYAEKVADSLQNQMADYGILICGTGLGMSMAANKFDGIRAAAVSEPFSASLARAHNDANVLCFGARVVGSGLATAIVEAFLTASFQAGRHQKRIDLITSFETK